MNGMVYLIGAGPGDPRLLTLRGAELLSRCDVVLYDGLSNDAILAHAPSAQHICVGKHGQQRIWRQEEIIQVMVDTAQKGLVVARLKGGDPAVFARTAEEVDALIAAGIRYEIVPGITAALAAGSYAGIPITHRKLASAVALVTGHEEPGKTESALDWHALARFPGTLVIYMGVTTAETWTKKLIENGKPAETPVAIIRRCSYADQRTFRCRLDEVADRLSPANKIRPPVIVIVGPVSELADSQNWIEQRPLHGKTILITRPEEQSEELARPLRELGATVKFQPAIRITAPQNWEEVDTAIDRLGEQDYVIFCSRNGVNYFIDRLLSRGGDTRSFANSKIACVGKQTAAALAAFHLRADIIPADFRAESLAAELVDQVNRKNIMILRASRGRDVLARLLGDRGAHVKEVVAYSHTDVTTADDSIFSSMRDGKVDWVTITSSATAESLHRLFGELMKKVKIATLSPVTSQTVREMGYNVDAEATPYTIEAMVEAIRRVEAINEHERGGT